MDTLSSFLNNDSNDDALVLLFGRHVIAGIVMVVVGAQFDNHFWRLFTCVIGRYVAMAFVPSLHYSANTWIFMVWWVLVYLTTLNIPHHPIYTKLTKFGLKRPFHKRQGCIFITGCDSGMGYTTAVHLAKTNNDKSDNNRYEIIFAGCYNVKESIIKYEKELGKEFMSTGLIQLVELNVVDDTSVTKATETIEKVMKEKNVIIGLTSLIQFHGIAYTGPAQYMPLDLYQKQFDVNTIGTYRVIQAILPLIRNRCDTSSKSNASIHDIVGRIILTGTGVGPLTPYPPLISAYLSSKFALEAYRGVLDAELYMLHCNIQTCMINPGIVKPTLLPTIGAKLVDSMYEACKKNMNGSNVAKDEFGEMHTHFINYQAAEPGTHVSQIAVAAEHALTAIYPRSSYKVGIDSKLGAIVGMFPTG